MTAKHTPGPWRVEERRKQGSVLISGAGTIDTAGGCEWQEFASVVVRMEGDEDDVDEGLANARLIAASPALADALEGLLALVDGMRGSGVPLIAEVDAAARAALRAAGRLP